MAILHFLMFHAVFLLFLYCHQESHAPDGIFDNDNIETGEKQHRTSRNEVLPTEHLTPLQRQDNNNYSNYAKDIIDEYRNYFVSPQGELPWQYNICTDAFNV